MLWSIWTCDLLWRDQLRLLQRVSPITSLPQILSFIAFDRFNGPHMFWLERIQSKLTWSDSSNRWLIKTISRLNNSNIITKNRFGIRDMDRLQWKENEVMSFRLFVFCLLPALAKALIKILKPINTGWARNTPSSLLRHFEKHDLWNYSINYGKREDWTSDVILHTNLKVKTLEDISSPRHLHGCALNIVSVEQMGRVWHRFLLEKPVATNATHYTTPRVEERNRKNVEMKRELEFAHR